MKAVFLDRDGVICEEINLLQKKEQFKIIHRAAESLHLLNKKGFKTILITNQPVVARGLCTLAELEEIHKYLKVLLAEKGAYLDGIYFCPHHPNPKKGPLGKNGPNLNYVTECKCRKPRPGLILQAKRDFKIENLSQCYMIGDSISDIKAGYEAGCKTILLNRKTLDPFSDAIPDFRAKDLHEAVTNIILKNEAIH